MPCSKFISCILKDDEWLKTTFPLSYFFSFFLSLFIFVAEIYIIKGDRKSERLRPCLKVDYQEKRILPFSLTDVLKLNAPQNHRRKIKKWKEEKKILFINSVFPRSPMEVLDRLLEWSPTLICNQILRHNSIPYSLKSSDQKQIASTFSPFFSAPHTAGRLK